MSVTVCVCVCVCVCERDILNCHVEISVKGDMQFRSMKISADPFEH